MMITPCKDCPDRHPICHDSCPKYAEFKRQRRQQMHVCPLQIDIVERLINRYSNPGDLIADPFAGLFTVPYEAVKMNRKGKGVELNPDYFRDGVGYLETADAERDAPTLFDLLENGA